MPRLRALQVRAVSGQAALFAVALLGCTHADRIALASSTAMLACDWGQTRSRASMTWSGDAMWNYSERNPFLGRHPDTATVDFYFASIIAANTVAWLLLPPKWRGAVAGGVTLVDGKSVYRNLDTTPGMCGR